MNNVDLMEQVSENFRNLNGKICLEKIKIGHLMVPIQSGILGTHIKYYIIIGARPVESHADSLYPFS